jgi:uncharacterized protein (DUF58 family)
LLITLILAGVATFRVEVVGLAIPLLVYRLAGMLLMPKSIRVQIQSRMSSERVMAGERIKIHTDITNEGDALEYMHIKERLPEGLQLAIGQNTSLIDLPKAGSYSLRYSVVCQRGLHKVPSTEVSICDPFALHEQALVKDHDRTILSLPPYRQTEPIQIRPRKTRVFSGLIPSRAGGTGIEFLGVRDYAPGDPLRWMNWRATSRHAKKLFVNEFEQERVADVALILDARSISNVLPGNLGSLLEKSIMGCAALAESFLRSGNRVGLLIYGGHLDWTFPAFGRIQKERILRALATADQGKSEIFDELENLPARLFPPRSQLVLFSPLLPEDYKVLIRLRARGYEVLVISPDPISACEKDLVSSSHFELALRIARHERKLLIRRLLHAGVRVVSWDAGISFERTLQAQIGRPTSWYRALGVKA